jgi:hypothetical protein
MLRRPIVHRTLAKLTSADIATYRDERLKDAAPATVVREDSSSATLGTLANTTIAKAHARA